MYGSGGRRDDDSPEDYERSPPAYEDIPSTEEVEAKKLASQYTDSLTDEQKDSKMKEGLKMAALVVLGLLGLGVMLIYLDFVLVPLVLSRFLIYIFQPFINVLVGKKAFPFCKVRFRLPRWVAVTAVLLLLIVIFAIFGFIVSMTISSIVDNADHYKARIDELMDSVIEFAEGYGYTREEIEAMIPEIDVGAYAVTTLSYLANILTQMVLVLLIVIYMLLGYDGSNKSQLRSAIDVRIRKYILIHSLISVATGVGTSIILFVFGVDLVLFNGLMAFVLNYIPNIGSVLGVVLPLPFVVFKEEFHIWELLAVAAALTILQFLTGQVIEPKILGNAMDIPPITVICALLFWGSLWGIIGAILSVPLTVSIQLYLDNMDHPAAKALAGMIVGDFKMFDSSTPREQKKDVAATKDDVELGGLSAVATIPEEYDHAGVPYPDERLSRPMAGADYYSSSRHEEQYGGHEERHGRDGNSYAYGGEAYGQGYDQHRPSRRTKP